MIRLDGKTAIVTGAAQGLGGDIARSLYEAGANIVIADKAAEAGLAMAQTLGAKAWFFKTDIEHDDDIAACIAAAIERFGALDILVNNACLYADSGLSSTRAEWLKTLNVNLVGAAIFTSMAGEYMTKPGGVIVNIGSVGGKVGAAGRALYPASKAALLQLTKNAAVTLAPQGIRVLSISPAWTWSPALETMAGTIEHADAVGVRLHPIGRVGRGQDIGNAVVFAVSDMASFITGIDIPVDGGFTILGPDQGRSPGAWFADAVQAPEKDA
jgi:NAD(P)-dependent dehydrogenase (short-subunit alcohol dehydrogenase family)